MLGLRPAAAALLAALGAAAGAALSAGRRGYEIEMRGEGSSEEKETKLPSKSEKGTTDKESEEERPLVVDIVAEAKGENCSSARSPAAAVMDADAAVAAAERERDESVRLKVRDAILAAGSRGPLPGLLGTRNYTRAALDVLAAARSDLMMRQVGLLVIEAALEALFPELVAVEERAGDDKREADGVTAATA